jgi:hypothetical protein
MTTTFKPNGTSRGAENLSGDMDFFTAYTLVDITDTGISDSRHIPVKEYNQAQNLNAMIQLVSLRTQPVMVGVDLVEDDLANYDFGSNFTGTQKVWILKFATERSGYTTEATLISDSSGLPITTGLDETVSITPAVLNSTSATAKNIYFVQHTTL